LTQYTAYRLTRPTAHGQALPPLVPRASVGPGLLGLDGMLGLDFLDQFAGIGITRSSSAEAGASLS
jgi:hypothetical protein